MTIAKTVGKEGAVFSLYNKTISISFPIFGLLLDY